MNRPYSEATVKLAVKAIVDTNWHPEMAGSITAEARAVLDALAAAGLLLPEGVETRTEYAVRWPEDRPSSFPLISGYMDLETAERFAASYQGVRGEVACRWTAAAPWRPVDAVRLAEGDNKPSQDQTEER